MDRIWAARNMKNLLKDYRNYSSSVGAVLYVKNALCPLMTEALV
jgi:hypothetical protein